MTVPTTRGDSDAPLGALAAREPADRELAREPADRDLTREPADRDLADRAPADHDPADRAPADHDPADRDPANGDLADRAPADHDPADRAPADHDPADRVPADRSPADGDLADRVPDDRERDRARAARAANETREIPRVERSAIALSLLFAYGVVAAIVVAMPLTEVTRIFYGGHPHGDAPLAEPGGLALADLLLGRGAAAFSAALPTSFVLVILGAVGAHLPFGALIAHLSMQGGTPRGTLREAYARSASRFFVLGSATLVSMAARAVVVVAAVALASLVSQSTQAKLGDRASDLVGLAVLLPFALLVLLVFVLSDLAYVAIVADGASLPRALLHAVRTLRSEGRRALFPALLAYTGGLATTAVAASSIGFFAIAASPALLFLTHQAALLTKTILRAAWLARAISFPPPQASSLTSGAPGPVDDSDDKRSEGTSSIEAASSASPTPPSAPAPTTAPTESAGLAVLAAPADAPMSNSLVDTKR